MPKVIEYQIATEVNYGTEENPDIKIVLNKKQIQYNGIVPDFVKNEAYNGEFEIINTLDKRPIDLIRQEYIQNSKKELESYLQSHPIQWTDGKFYSITREKQQQLTSKLFAASAAKQAGTEYELKWNSTGDECVIWTLEELFKLAFYIDSHVTALVSYQQALEKQINACQTAEEIESIVINYDSVK